MITRSEIVNYLDMYLAINDVEDDRSQRIADKEKEKMKSTKLFVQLMPV